MTYTSYAFLIFIVITTGIYYTVHKKRQWLVLLFSSIIFYICSGPVFLIWLLSFTFFTWYGAGKMEKSKAGRKAVLAVLIFMNIGVLFLLKWSGMELAFINRVFGTNLGWRVVLPMGMSFFTFQNVSYSVDVYRGKIPAERDFWHYLLYASYFPYIVSGPVNRYEKMGAQFCAGHSFDRDAFYHGMLRILWGYMKKMVIADRAAIFVDEVFGHYYMYRGIFIVIAVLLFSLQLYMDFSGCMDIVLGVSKLFGIEMAENFRAPYGAVTVADFWRRWHISLSTWFKEYVYIPLGGNRVDKPRLLFNLLIVWAATGIWHGASWNFLLWGLYYGFLLVLEKFFLGRYLERCPRWLQHCYTLFFIAIGWALFAVEDFSHLGPYLSAMLGFAPGGLTSGAVLYYLRSYLPMLLTAAAASTPLAKKLWDRLGEKPRLALLPILLLAGLLLCTAYLVDATYNPFLYFRF